MKKLKMARGVTLTFEAGCNKYLENCRQRNLREGTINHYRQSIVILLANARFLPIIWQQIPCRLLKYRLPYDIMYR